MDGGNLAWRLASSASPAAISTSEPAHSHQASRGRTTT